MAWFDRTGVVAAYQRQEVAKADNSPAKPPNNPSRHKLISAPGDSVVDVHSAACAKLDAITKSLNDLIAEHEATMRKINGQDDGDDDGSDPTAAPAQRPKLRQPGTSNLVHDTHPESTLAPRDGRTVHSIHNVNRQVRGVPSPVTKSAHVQGGGSVRLVNGAGLDLSSMFEGVQLKPA